MDAESTSKRLSPRTRATVGFHSHQAVVVVAEAVAVMVEVEEVTSTATMEVAVWAVVIIK